MGVEGEKKAFYLRVPVFQGIKKELIWTFICRFSQRNKSLANLMFSLFFPRRSVCAWDPFICLSLAPRSPSRPGVWETVTFSPACDVSADYRRPLKPLHSSLPGPQTGPCHLSDWRLSSGTEPRRPPLIRTFVFHVSHLDVERKPHLCNLLLCPAWKTGLHKHRQERIMALSNYSYLWASDSKWDNYRPPLTVISDILPLLRGSGSHCDAGPFHA